MPIIVVSRRRFGRRVRRNAVDNAIRNAEEWAKNRTHPKMEMVAGGLRVVVPYAPRETTLTGFGWTYTEVIRPGRKPLTVRQNLNNWKQSFDLFLGSQDLNESISHQWIPLKQMIEGTTPITIVNGPGTGRSWYITSASMQALQRAQQTNAISRAVLSIEMTEATEIVPAPGPVAAAQPPGTPKPAPPPPPPPAPAHRHHTVVRGDSLSLISKKYYGTINRWQELAKVNNIRNPNRIYPGQRLTIP